MARFGIDTTAVLHGERAVRRCTRNLVRHLVGLHQNDHWSMLYFDRTGKTQGRLSFPPNALWSERVCRFSMRALLPCWRSVGYPTVETWLGRVDVLYAPDMYFPPTSRAPVLCTIHGMAYLAIPERCESKKVRALAKAFAYARRRAHHFLAVSESTRKDLLLYTDLPPDRIHVVTHGVDPMFGKGNPADSMKKVQDRFHFSRPYVLYVGAIGHHKNILGLLKAMTLAAPRMGETDLVLAGPFDDAIHEARTLVAQSGIQDRVHFSGAIDGEDEILVHLYRAARGLVFTTFYEGWCAPPLEAMACGIPVIASAIPSVREVVEDAAVLLPPDDIEGWAEALIRLAEDARWRNDWAEQGFKHVQQHTWERAAGKLYQVLTRLQEAAA